LAYDPAVAYFRVLTHPGKSCNLRKKFSRPGKSRKVTVVMESHGIPPIGHGIFLQKDNHFRSLKETKL